jgi:hypothetical protein
MIRMDAGDDDVVGTVLPQPADESWAACPETNSCARSSPMTHATLGVDSPSLVLRWPGADGLRVQAGRTIRLNHHLLPAS